jgi:hypothetical protein
VNKRPVISTPNVENDKKYYESGLKSIMGTSSSVLEE